MKITPKITVLYHIFYEDTYDTVCTELESLVYFGATFLFNICSETPDKNLIAAVLRSKFHACYIIYTSNKGKDVGAKLALLELFFQLKVEADYLLFLHDKKSLQALKSATWKKDLLKIISLESITKVLKIFQEKKETGIIATNEYIINERFENGHFSSINGHLLTEVLTNYKIKPSSYLFVAGTMFWAKSQPVEAFFNQYSPLDIRKKLEDGNVLDNFSGTVTHSWERALSWIITSQGYSIVGI